VTSLRQTCVLVVIALAAAAPARGQVAEQKTLTLAGARTVADAAATEARKHNAGGAIAIVDAGGNLLFLQRLDNTFPAAAAVAIEKARTAATFRRPTRDFENAIKNGRTSLLGVAIMTPLQGGVPIVGDGQVLGAVGVSGATSAQEDDDIATAASTALGGNMPTASNVKP
jgi:glc operon protein GlcG